jgi:single stranded DNA-binding protein
LAEIAGQYLQKWKKVYIEGRLKTKSWEAQDGTKRYKTEIIAENLIMLNPKGSNVWAQDYEVEVSEWEDDQAIVKKAETKVSTKPVKKEEEINIEDIPF